MERTLLRTTLYFALAFCVIGVFAAATPEGVQHSALGLLVAVSALYLGPARAATAPAREDYEHVDSFRIGPPPRTPGPAPRLPNAGPGRPR